MVVTSTQERTVESQARNQALIVLDSRSRARKLRRIAPSRGRRAAAIFFSCHRRPEGGDTFAHRVVYACAMPDISMESAFRLARFLGEPAAPPWLSDIPTCATLVNLADNGVSPRIPHSAYVDEQHMMNALNTLFGDWARNPNAAPGCASAAERKNVLLRLWSGCIGTAKTIKHQPNQPQPTTPEERAAAFTILINPHCAECPIYAAGSIAAVHFMSVTRPQAHELRFEGVPVGSLVLSQRPPGQ
jgi:hypothetical protein